MLEQKRGKSEVKAETVFGNSETVSAKESRPPYLDDPASGLSKASGLPSPSVKLKFGYRSCLVARF
ncbi:MAG: hypothetical protein ACPL5F_10720 [Moorellaceae bacterium]